MFLKYTLLAIMLISLLGISLNTLWADSPNQTPDPQAIRELAESGISSNSEWQPYSEIFDEVEMVLVPSGCFMMGSETVEDEQPIHEQCFDEPFWIDKTEVTNEQYGSVECEEWSSEPKQPRNCVNWSEAKDYCETRDGRLPTEREWEYVARGPNSLTYPWGNEFVAANVVYYDNSSNQIAEVGSHPAGASWVGAMDMSGNLWEWTSSLYRSYPYEAEDGRESANDEGTVRVIRSSAFYDEFKSYTRSANRNSLNPDYNFNSVGIRCVRDYEPE